MYDTTVQKVFVLLHHQIDLHERHTMGKHGVNVVARHWANAVIQLRNISENPALIPHMFRPCIVLCAIFQKCLKHYLAFYLWMSEALTHFIHN